jgi:hypothetical protein
MVKSINTMKEVREEETENGDEGIHFFYLTDGLITKRR